MAGKATKRWRIACFPGVIAKRKDKDYRECNDKQRHDAHKRFRIGWGQKEAANCSKETLHG
jgi:hypothetical protein